MTKLLKWVGMAVLLLVVLPLAVVIIINAFDDKLDPKAAAYGAVRPASMADDENGYYAVIALSAPDGADGLAYARAWVAEGRAAANEKRAENRPPVKRAKRPDLCDPSQVSCIGAARDKAQEMAAQLESYREDLERYEKLLGYKRYEEAWDYVVRLDAQLPSYTGVIAAQRAHLLRAVLALNAGNVEDALGMVERDMAFQRVMLAGARTLIGKMVANALLMRDLALVMDMLQQQAPALKPHAARLAAMTPALDRNALRMDTAFEAEFGWVKQAYASPDAARSAGLGGLFETMGISLFYKKNATLNKAYEVYSGMATASQKSAAGFTEEWRKLPTMSGARPWWDYIDNPVGKILLDVGMPSFDGYVLRMHDLDALNRLTGLRIAMLEADVSAEHAATFVAKSDARFHDPYTGKPMAWDASAKQLSFKGSENLAKRKLFNLENGRVVLKL